MDNMGRGSRGIGRDNAKYLLLGYSGVGGDPRVPLKGCPPLEHLLPLNRSDLKVPAGRRRETSQIHVAISALTWAPRYHRQKNM